MDELSRLLVEARDGSQFAFAAFVQRSQAEIWRFCAQMLGPALADDATQETYLSAWRSMPSFRGDSSARTWLFVIARRTTARLRRRRADLLELEGLAPPPSGPPDPQHWTELGAIMDRLGEDRRLALLLTQVLGLSYAEAAEVCGCAVGTIRSRVARAREELLGSWTGVREGSRATSRAGTGSPRSNDRGGGIDGSADAGTSGWSS